MLYLNVETKGFIFGKCMSGSFNMILHLLFHVVNSDLITDWTDDRIPIWGKDYISFAVYCAH